MPPIEIQLTMSGLVAIVLLSYCSYQIYKYRHLKLVFHGVNIGGLVFGLFNLGYFIYLLTEL